MKSCPTCNQTFTDPNLSFCIDDGTPLVSAARPEDETTVVSPTLGESVSPPTEAYKPRDWQTPDYQPPGSAVVTPARRKTWPWMVGVLAVVGIGVIGMGIAGILVSRVLRPDPVRSSANPSVERAPDPPFNLNSNAPVANSNNENRDTSTDEDEASLPPSDKEVVLAALRDLEQEWTVANINADKQKLNRILADDYVGTSNGRSQGKAEYLNTIERDLTIQNWKFEDLRVDLMRDRATLEGLLRIQLPDKEAAFKFKDKFVWRDGRWQAVSSEVSQIE